MKRTLFVLNSVEDFAPGAFENTTMDEGSIQLGRSGHSYLAEGCYTSPSFTMEPFMQLVPSWNADTPAGTSVEAQVRIASGGKWSRWFNFGRWSPFIDRHSFDTQEDDLATVETDILTVNPAFAPADTVQVRIRLYSEDSSLSPMVRLLSVAVDPMQWEEDIPVGYRVLEIPRYSCLVRDPSIASRIASATSICMLMNRWGEDTLPEEVARAAYDSGRGWYGNLSFLTGVAGCYGYTCHARFASIDFLRREIHRGNAAAAHVRYHAQLMPEEENEGEKSALAFPSLEGASADSTGHLIVVRGFTKEDNEEFVVVNDPLADSDEETLRTLPLKTFAEIYTGLCLVLHKGVKGAGCAKPARVVAELEVEQHDLRLMRHGRVLFPGQISLDEVGGITVCYTLPDSIAYASAAQKKFYYLTLNEKEAFGFDRAGAAGKKISFYLIGSFGRTWVAEKLIKPAPAEEETQA